MSYYLFDRIRFQFTNIPTELLHLTELEWKEMILHNLMKLEIKQKGYYLINELLKYLRTDYIINISNKDTRYFSTIYPKVIYNNPKNVTIIIPNVPYFVNVETENNIELMPQFIGLAHELIHCLRYFKDLLIDGPEEENQTIQSNDFICENDIRNEWKLSKRISHNSTNVFCYGDHKTYINSKNFSKYSFFS